MSSRPHPAKNHPERKHIPNRADDRNSRSSPISFICKCLLPREANRNNCGIWTWTAKVLFKVYPAARRLKTAGRRGLVGRAAGRRATDYHPDEYNKVVILRRALTGVPPVEAMELMLNKLKKTRSNIEFLLGMAVG